MLSGGGVSFPDPTGRLERDLQQLLQKGCALQTRLHDRRLEIHGTIPTTVRGATYNTPLRVWINVDDAAARPIVEVPVSDALMVTPLPPKSYQLDRRGRVQSCRTLQGWSASSRITQLVEELQKLFSTEPPLVSRPADNQQRQRHLPNLENRIVGGGGQAARAHGQTRPEEKLDQVINSGLRSRYGETGGYSTLGRVRKDVIETMQKYPELMPREVEAFGGVVLSLHGTIPVDYGGARYHIPVQVRIPHAYPADGSAGRGRPQILVVPAADMEISPHSQEVDPSTGEVSAAFIAWHGDRRLAETIARCQRHFGTHMPVYSVRGRRQAGGRVSPTVQPNVQMRPAASPAAQATALPPLGGTPSKEKDNVADMLKRLESERGDECAVDDSKLACVICMANQKNQLTLPCKHISMCRGCTIDLLKRQDPHCPMCRSQIDDIMTVFS
eukprot:Hpha_TRINITY_DN15882_c1_g4::TRINITY_DN15882_c1_g4_i1::g.189225::m.189225